MTTLPGLGSGRCLVIGEVALSHDGSLGLAHAFVDAIAAAGADAVKFQTHIAKRFGPAWQRQYDPSEHPCPGDGNMGIGCRGRHSYLRY